MNRFVFTCGDINGIGPEIVVKCLNRITKNSLNKFVFICPANVFEQTISTVKPAFQFAISKTKLNHSPGIVSIIDIGEFKITSGKPTKNSGEAAFRSIETSFKFAIQKKVDGIITAPISKFAINSAGHKFPGHTEMYAEWSGKESFIMTFLSKKMNAALVTIHEPVKKMPSMITVKRLNDAIGVIVKTLEFDLGINSPKIAVLGLNPHAGEDGLIGNEEIKIIKPALEHSNFKKYLYGPFSPDAFFANKMYKKFDITVGMYHDQVLIPFKLMNFGKGVNYTAGLPIVRTSPDHGVAFDIAGKNKANEDSILEAFIYAEKIVNNRKCNAERETK